MRLAIPATALLMLLWGSGWLLGQSQSAYVLHIVASTDSYVVGTYVQPPALPANAVFFVGEEGVELELTIGNRDAAAHLLNTRSIPIERAFRLTALRLPRGGLAPRLIPLEDGQVVTQERSSVIRWDDDIEVPAHGSVRFRALLVLQGVTVPGLYELQVLPRFEGLTVPVNPAGTLVRYELREASTSADRAERIRRRMTRATRAADAGEAAAASEELLTVYPFSSAAYQVRAELAQQAGRRDDAIAAFERARELLTSKQDSLYLAHAPGHAVQQAVEGLTRIVTSLRR